MRDPVSKIKGERDGERHVSIYYLSKCTIFIHSPLPHTSTQKPYTHVRTHTYHTYVHVQTHAHIHTQAHKFRNTHKQENKTFRHQTFKLDPKL